MTDSIAIARQAARLEAVERRLTAIERRLDRVLGDEAEAEKALARASELLEPQN